MKIKILNPIFSRVESGKSDIGFLSTNILNYKATYYREGPFRKVAKEYLKSLVTKEGLFLTGFIPRIEKYCEILKIPLEIEENTRDATIDTLLGSYLSRKFRPEQDIAVAKMIYERRGIIHYPTGSGKTEIFLAFLAYCKPEIKSLIIVHTKDLLHQTLERAQKFLDRPIGFIGDGCKKIEGVTIGMIQTLNRKREELKEYFESLSVVIVDEAHHVSHFSKTFKSSGTYANVLELIPAPLRFGFTATLPYQEEAKMAIEGYLGPVIAQLKAQDSPHLSKVRVKLKRLPKSKMIEELKTYKEVYNLGVVYNSRRNLAVATDANQLVQEDKTVLILVTAIQHGFNIKEMIERRFPNITVEFVWGDKSGEERESIKKDLNEKRINIVVSDVVWREGVDIPTLGAIINASDNKSEILTRQGVGRGLRKVPGVKGEVILVDYFDPSHRYLRDHFSERLVLYFEEKWLGEEEKIEE